MTLKSAIVAFGALVGAIAGIPMEAFADGIIGLRLDEKATKNGILISQVMAGSPADQAGLRVESVITHVDGEPVETMADCLSAISSHSPGERVRLTVIDDGETTVLPVFVVARGTQFTAPKVRDNVEEALEEVRDVGGSVEKDLRRPRRPVFRVRLDAHRTSDRSLKFIAAFDQLTELIIDQRDESARLTGTGLADLSGSMKLKKLAFPGGTLDLTLAKRVCKLPQIRTLDLTKAAVTREALQELATGLTLTELVLNGVELSDDDLKPIGQMPSLRKLNLNNTKVKGLGLSHLKPLSRLTHLYLFGTGTNDSQLANLADMTQMTELGLSYTAVTDQGLPYLKKMEHLESLGLSHEGGSGITADGLETNLKHLKNLRELWIEGPEFEPSDVRHLGRLWPKAKIVTSRKVIVPADE